jgi:hypothetical protein
MNDLKKLILESEDSETILRAVYKASPEEINEIVKNDTVLKKYIEVERTVRSLRNKLDKNKKRG